jgi:glycosyltransferase involved in cell wall biosynthesis
MHIIYVGYPGFPQGFAQVERQKLIAKGLTYSGCHVTVISRYGIHDRSNVPSRGTYKGIDYMFASGLSYRPSGFFRRNYNKVKGLIQEISLLLSLRRASEQSAILITTNSFYNVAIYSICAYIAGVPAVLDHVEYWGKRANSSLLKRLDNILYDTFATKISTQVICISNYLLIETKRQNPTKSVLKVPVIVDFTQFQEASNPDEPYFLFCGSAGYFETIDFVIRAFEHLGEQGYSLYLIAYGNDEQMDRVTDRIASSPLASQIKHFYDLPYAQLTQYYMMSRALLIPLLDTVQDEARFPHKIGEYCAAGRAIITTNIGEVKHYFKDGENALIASKLTPASFSEKMQFVIDNPEIAAEVGYNGNTLGKEHFNYLKLGSKISAFIQQRYSTLHKPESILLH